MRRAVAAVSFARQQMLLHSFSFLPVRREDGWYLVSDCAVAQYLAGQNSAEGDRKRIDQALARSIEEASAEGLLLEPGSDVRPTCSKAEALARTSPSRPLLVTDAEGRLLGIVTPFDLL